MASAGPANLAIACEVGMSGSWEPVPPPFMLAAINFNLVDRPGDPAVAMAVPRHGGNVDPDGGNGDPERRPSTCAHARHAATKKLGPNIKRCKKAKKIDPLGCR